MSHLGETEEKQPPRQPWNVTPDIWITGPADQTRTGRILRRGRNALGYPLPILPVLLVTIVPITLVTLILAVARLSGIYTMPALASAFAGIIIATDYSLKKLGYGRNFDYWDFPLRRTLLVPVAFLLVLGLIYFLILIVK